MTIQLVHYRAADRVVTQLPWLESRHSFSFGDYYNPSLMGHGALRVINDDIIAPGKGFDTHPHRDMEILTYIISGELEHRDSMGHRSVLRSGDLQRMSAGRGILHSEYNASSESSLHLLQIWIIPERRGLAPSYEERRASDSSSESGPIHLLASPSPSGDAVTIHQAMELNLIRLDKSQSVKLPYAKEGLAWLHLFQGTASLEEYLMESGDGMRISEQDTELTLRSDSGALALYFVS